VERSKTTPSWPKKRYDAITIVDTIQPHSQDFLTFFFRHNLILCIPCPLLCNVHQEFISLFASSPSFALPYPSFFPLMSPTTSTVSLIQLLSLRLLRNTELEAQWECFLLHYELRSTYLTTILHLHLYSPYRCVTTYYRWV
jgi:hypothetical protein